MGSAVLGEAISAIRDWSVTKDKEPIPARAGEAFGSLVFNDAEQQKRLQEEFKTLLVRTYAGAFSQVKDQTVSLKPMRGGAEDNEVVVRTEVRGKSDPIQLDYRLEKSPAGWKIYDVNVMGVWLGETYRSSFAQEIGANGIDGLIAKLTDKNKAAGRS